MKKKYQFLLAQVTLMALGIAFLLSAFEHLFYAHIFEQHYIEAGLGKRGALFIGILQLFGGTGLIIFRFQKIAGAVVSLVMLVAIINNLIKNNFPFIAFIVLIISVLPTLYIFLKKR